MKLQAMVGDGLGDRQFCVTVQCQNESPVQLGERAAYYLLEQGVEPLLTAFRS